MTAWLKDLIDEVERDAFGSLDTREGRIARAALDALCGKLHQASPRADEAGLPRLDRRLRDPLMSSEHADQRIGVEEVRQLRDAAVALLHLSAKHYGAPGLAVDGSRAESLRALADKIEQRMSI